MKTAAYAFLGFVLALGASSPALAGGKGEGGCVASKFEGDAFAPIYRSEDGDKIEAKAQKGDCFAGITTMGLSKQYLFERKNGRVHIIYFASPDQKGIQRTAWIKEEDLEPFMYECGCGEGRHKGDECSPLGMAGFATTTWNPCFREARAKKLEEIKSRGSAPARAAGSDVGGKSLRNDDVLSLVKVGLDDALIVSKVQTATAAEFDLSTDALVSLKKAGVSNAVVAAMMKRSEKK